MSFFCIIYKLVNVVYEKTCYEATTYKLT